MDNRPSSPKIASIVYGAVKECGFEVDFLWSVANSSFSSTIYEGEYSIYTGTHIPFDRNGIKFYTSNSEISKENEAVLKLCLFILSAVLFCLYC